MYVINTKLENIIVVVTQMCWCVWKMHIPVPWWWEGGWGRIAFFSISTSLQSSVIDVMAQEGGGICNS